MVRISLFECVLGCTRPFTLFSLDSEAHSTRLLLSPYEVVVSLLFGSNGYFLCHQQCHWEGGQACQEGIGVNFPDASSYCKHGLIHTIEGFLRWGVPLLRKKINFEKF